MAVTAPVGRLMIFQTPYGYIADLDQRFPTFVHPDDMGDFIATFRHLGTNLTIRRIA